MFSFGKFANEEIPEESTNGKVVVVDPDDSKDYDKGEDVPSGGTEPTDTGDEKVDDGLDPTGNIVIKEGEGDDPSHRAPDPGEDAMSEDSKSEDSKSEDSKSEDSKSEDSKSEDSKSGETTASTTDPPRINTPSPAPSETSSTLTVSIEDGSSFVTKPIETQPANKNKTTDKKPVDKDPSHEFFQTLMNIAAYKFHFPVKKLADACGVTKDLEASGWHIPADEYSDPETYKKEKEAYDKGLLDKGADGKLTETGKYWKVERGAEESTYLKSMKNVSKDLSAANKELVALRDERDEALIAAGGYSYKDENGKSQAITSLEQLKQLKEQKKDGKDIHIDNKAYVNGQLNEKWLAENSAAKTAIEKYNAAAPAVEGQFKNLAAKAKSAIDLAVQGGVFGSKLENSESYNAFKEFFDEKSANYGKETSYNTTLTNLVKKLTGLEEGEYTAKFGSVKSADQTYKDQYDDTIAAHHGLTGYVAKDGRVSQSVSADAKANARMYEYGLNDYATPDAGTEVSNEAPDASDNGDLSVG